MNKAPDTRSFIEEFGPNGKFLFSALSQFGLESTWKFFEDLKIPLKVENDNKVFPQSDDGRDVLSALTKEMKKLKVEIKFKSPVSKINLKEGLIDSITLENKEKIQAKKFILCCGGKSYPLTGSTGDGYDYAESLGHTITPLLPALTPLILNDQHINTIEGVAIKQVLLQASLNKKIIAKVTGDIMFTADGISGPATITLSQKIATQVEHGLNLRIDLFPNLDKENLDKQMIKLLSENPNKELHSVMTELLPQRFVKYLSTKYFLDFSKKCNIITAKERKDLGEELKNIEYRTPPLAKGGGIKNLEGFDKAMITVGGVNLKEVDPKTMQSKIIKNLYFAGEILDLAGPTGGYNLQVCWSTGYTAGNSATME
ncbi:MAG: HI0933 family protein [Parcubacteria group bacterium GW2011_GWC2_38_7]|nr:MAG: HI0933 family protein [Parcubacteria group bacterium GW2011_GWC2_38_7]